MAVKRKPKGTVRAQASFDKRTPDWHRLFAVHRKVQRWQDQWEQAKIDERNKAEADKQEAEASTRKNTAQQDMCAHVTVSNG